MSTQPGESALVSELLERVRAGDPDAPNALVERTLQRLRHLARQMLNGSPALRRWTGSDDLLQNALIRLLRALEAVRPECSRSYFGLAALQLRRELIDFARHCYGPRGYAANHASGSDRHLLDTGRRVDSSQPE
ncbi:MAG: ECF-type sigma factor, partial [Planctomycetaceae bacterium]